MKTRSLLIVFLVLLALPAFSQATGPVVFYGQGIFSGNGILGGTLAPASFFLPALPTTWVDNNELECGYTPYPACSLGSPALTTPYTAPAYKLALTAGGGSWTLVSTGASTSAPGCVQHGGTYTRSSIGLTNAWSDQDYCRTNNSIGIIVAADPNAVEESVSGCTSRNSNTAYCFNTGAVIPQTASASARIPLVFQST